MIRYLSFIMLSIMCMLQSCNSSGKQAEEDNTADSVWHEISPLEIKNAIELFDTDWMALAVGNEGDMSAMTISWGEIGELWNKPVLTVYVL